MKKSILKTEPGVCYICKRQTDTALHHIYFGPKRKISDKNGFVCFLCPTCHQYGAHAVHKCREVDLYIKAICQKVYEKTHTREEFMALIGRNYIHDEKE